MSSINDLAASIDAEDAEDETTLAKGGEAPEITTYQGFASLGAVPRIDYTEGD